MSRVYASTVCLPQKVPVLDRVTAYQKHGIHAIELGGGVFVKEGDLVALSQSRATLLIHNYFPPLSPPFYINLSSPDEGIRNRSVDFIIENVERSASWGAELYSFHAGFIADPVGVDQDGLIFDIPPADAGQVEIAMQRFLQSLEPLLHAAHANHVALAIENNVCREAHRGRLLLQTASEFLYLFGQVSDPYVGILIDTGHVEVSAHTLGFSAKSFYRALRPYIKAFHVSQNDGVRDLALPISVDNPVLDQLHDVQVPVIVEAYFQDIKQLCKHMKWLQQRLEEH